MTDLKRDALSIQVTTQRIATDSDCACSSCHTSIGKYSTGTVDARRLGPGRGPVQIQIQHRTGRRGEDRSRLVMTLINVQNHCRLKVHDIRSCRAVHNVIVHFCRAAFESQDLTEMTQQQIGCPSHFHSLRKSHPSPCPLQRRNATVLSQSAQESDTKLPMILTGEDAITSLLLFSTRFWSVR